MVREKGMAVVEKPPETRIHSTLYALLVFVSPEQNDLFSLTKNRVRQLVLVGEFWTALRNPDPKMCKSITVETRSKYVETLSILDKLFICKAHFPELGPLSFMTELQSVVPVYLVHCFADLFACTVRFREFDPFRFGCPQFRDSSWVLKLIVPFVDVTWDYNDKREILKHVAFHADIDELVWPYPDEQLQWMLRTLSIVDRDTRHALIYADEVWKRDSQMVRMAYYTSNTPEAKQFAREVGAVFEGRELLPLDLAFLGRLLVFMNSNSAIPNFKPPPKAFPVDFTEPPPLQRSQ